MIKPYSNMNFEMIRYIISNIMRIEAYLMTVPLAISLYLKEDSAKGFVISIFILILLSFFLSRKNPTKTEFYAKEGVIMVSLAWVILSLFGSLPFYISREIPIFIDAFFETVSGFTTTGATILNDIESMSKGLLFWRSLTHWIGGMGVLLFAMAVLPQQNDNGMYIIKAEVPGHSVGKLVAKASYTARILYGIYIFLTVVEIVLLLAGDMSLYDSCIHAMSTGGTGGFSCRNASVAYYDSAYIDTVISVFMVLFGINFNLYYCILIGELKNFYKSEELRTYLGIIFVATALIVLNIYPQIGSVSHAIRLAFFQVSSIITTTGFITADYTKWPLFSQGILMLIMFIGAMSGSTGGGIKVSRAVIATKKAFVELKRAVHPKRIKSINFEGEPINDGVIDAIFGYLWLYILIYLISCMLLLFQNFDMLSVFGAVTTCINNVGPGLGICNPVSNFAEFDFVSKIVLSFDMLAGRLEIFPMVALFMPFMWRKRG